MVQAIHKTAGGERSDFPGDTNECIQAAVDAVAAEGGGTVTIVPGRYTMHDSLHLRSGVTLQGSGDDTVLWKPPCVRSRTKFKLGYGHYDVSVYEPEKFRPGQGIHITDDRSGGFLDTVATITYIEDSELGLSDCLHNDILEGRNGRATTVYPIISGLGIRDAAVKHVAIDGNRAENDYLHGCRGGGVFLIQAQNVVLEHVAVRRYNGDGFSYQQCTDVTLIDCVAEGNGGYGAHPGSGSVGSLLRRCVFSDNDSDGIYYCLRVSDSICEDCVIEGNGKDGISIGHRDERLLIRGNRIAGNRRSGIWYREDELHRTGRDTTIADNEFAGNGTDSGGYHIRFNTKVCRGTVVGNKVADGELYFAQHPAYVEDVSFDASAGLSGADADALRRRSRHLGGDVGRHDYTMYLRRLGGHDK